MIRPTRRAKSSISPSKRASRSSSWTPKTARMITARVIRWVCGRIANGSPTGQLSISRAGHLDDQLAVALDPLAVEGRQQQLALAHVRAVVEGQDRVRPERRLEHGRVRLAGVEDGGVAGEERFDQAPAGRRRRCARSRGSGPRRCRRSGAGSRRGSRAGRAVARAVASASLRRWPGIAAGRSLAAAIRRRSCARRRAGRGRRGGPSPRGPGPGARRRGRSGPGRRPRRCG